MNYKLVFISLLLLPTLAFAQFDDSESEAAMDPKDDLSNELTETTTEKPDEQPFEKADVSKEDISRLAQAKKSKNEAAIVKAAAEILSKDPNHLLALNTLGIFYFESKKYGISKILFERALRTSKQEPALYNNLGIVFLAEGDLPLAMDYFKKSIAAKSDYKIGATNLSSIYLEYGDFKRAIAPLEDGYKATRSDLRRGDSSAIEIANNYAVALMGIGENDKAKGIYENIYEANVRNPIPYLNYAILLVEVQKKKKDAFRVISKLKFMTEDKEILRRVDELEKKLE